MSSSILSTTRQSLQRQITKTSHPSFALSSFSHRSYAGHGRMSRPQAFTPSSQLFQQLSHQFDRQSARFFEDVPEKKPRVSTSFTPSYSQKNRNKYMKDPYLVDRHGRPVFDYFKLQRFDTAKYPAIETQPFVFTRKEKDELRVKTPQEVKGRFEYRKGIHSDEFLEAGASDEVRKIFSWDNASDAEINKMKIQQVIAMFQKKDGDTGSVGVQVAVITQKNQEPRRAFEEFAPRQTCQTNDAIVHRSSQKIVEEVEDL
mmetsp:Transcript_3668/g.13955  ORF Transcript_3668/g.13955 Transcript_3668/m.13955 type:complete len:258 (-) Transcript_3668:145-918(-)